MKQKENLGGKNREGWRADHCQSILGERWSTLSLVVIETEKWMGSVHMGLMMDCYGLRIRKELKLIPGFGAIEWGEKDKWSRGHTGIEIQGWVWRSWVWRWYNLGID